MNMTLRGRSAILFALLVACALAPAIPSARSAEAAETGSESRDWDFANGLYQRGMHRAAAEKYEAFINDYPDSGFIETAAFRKAEAFYQMALAEERSDPVQAKIAQVEAQFAFQDYIERFPEGERIHDALLRHGELSYKLDGHESGLASLQRVIAGSVEAALVEPALFYAARCHDALGRPDDAAALYKRLRNEFPKGPYAAFAGYLLAGSLEKAGQPAEAVQLLQSLWENPPETESPVPGFEDMAGQARLLAAQILYRMEAFERSARIYEAYIETLPEGDRADKAAYGAAWSWFRAGDFAKALNVSKRLQRQTLPPEMAAGLLFLRGTCSYRQEKYKDAVTYFRQIISDPNAGGYRERAWRQLAWSHFFLEDYEDAERVCRDLLGQPLGTGASANAHFLLGQLYARMDRPAEAADEMQLALSLAPDGEYAADALFTLAGLRERLGWHAEAAEAYERFAEGHPGSDRAAEALARAIHSRYASGDNAKAVQLTGRLLDLQPDHPARADLLHRKGLALYQSGELDAALGAFNESIAAGGGARADALYWAAFIHEQKNDLQTAGGLYARLLEEYPEYGNAEDVRIRKAYCEYKGGDFAESYKAFREALFSEGGGGLTPEIVFWTIDYASSEGRPAEALENAERARELFKDDAARERLAVAIGELAIGMERWEMASSGAEEALKRFPESRFKPELLWVSGRALEGMDRKDEALERYAAALAESHKLGGPDPALEAELYLRRGRILEERERWDEAVEAFLRVAILYDHPEMTPEAMHRGIRCHLELGEGDEAGLLYNDLMKNYGDGEWAEKARQAFGDQISMKK